MGQKFSPANYESRRANLAGLLVAAQAEFSRAALAAELGEGSEEALAKAKADIAELEERIDRLDKAFEQSEADEQRERDEQRAKAMAKVADAVDDLLAERVATAKRMDKLARDLAAAFDAFTQAGDAIVTAVKPFGKDFVGDDLQNLRQEISKPGIGLYEARIAGLLCLGGLDLSHIDAHGAGFQVQERGLVEHVDVINQSVRRRVAFLKPEAVDA